MKVRPKETTRWMAEMASVEAMGAEIEKKHKVHYASRRDGSDGVLISHNPATTKLGDIFPDVFAALKLKMAETPKLPPATKKKAPPQKKHRMQPVVKARPMTTATIKATAQQVEKLVVNGLKEIARRDAGGVSTKFDIRGDASYAVAFIA